MTKKDLDKGISEFWARYWAKYPGERPSGPRIPNSAIVLVVIAVISFIFWVMFGDIK